MTIVEAPDGLRGAIALLTAAGTVERATSMFLSRYGADDSYLAAHRHEIQQIVEGELGGLPLELAGVRADAVAVLAPDGQRYALLTVARGEHDEALGETHPLLEWPIDDSPAIIWLKDLEGRYIRVNSRFAEALQADPEQVCGKTDAELSPRGSIDAVRLQQNDLPTHEPTDLEYTIPEFGGRPGFAVLRFALRDAEGEPVAVCGIAAPLADARVARSETERLIRIERWSRLDEDAIREAVLEDWDLTLADDATPLPGQAVEGSPAQRAYEQFEALSAERDAALASVTELEARLGQLQAEDETLREQLEQATHAETHERQTVEQLREDMAVAEAEATRLREAAEQDRARAERTAAEAHDELAQARDELQLAHEEAETSRASQTWVATSQRALSAALSGVTDWREALKRAVKTLGEKGDADAVVAWSSEERRGRMGCVAMWAEPAAGLETFETDVWQSRRDMSGGEFGRARGRSAPTCLLDLESAEDTLLRAAAGRGIGRCVLVPVRSGVETAAMLGLFSRAAAPPDPELMLSLEAIGLQLGTVSQLLELAAAPRWVFGRT